LNEGVSELPVRIAAATGLSSIIASGAVLRCCERAGVDPRRMTHADLAQMLPSMQAVLRIYLTADEVAAGMAKLRRLAENS
jgi:hypothetical protein